jgi:acyl-CoA thioesterase FadM
MRIRLKKMNKKFKKMIHLKRRAMIKGEITMIKTRKMIKKYRVKDRHTQESTKRFKEITP